MTCPRCNLAAPDGARFCPACGTRLAAADAGRFASPGAYTPPHLARRILDARAAVEGERKQVTVLFADIHGLIDVMGDRDPEEVVAFASKVCRPEADVLLCSCTAWRSVEAVGELERRTGKPVVSSNQASIWAAFRALGLRPKITGYGRLLESLAA